MGDVTVGLPLATACNELAVSSCLQSLCGIDIHLTLGKKKVKVLFLKTISLIMKF